MNSPKKPAWKASDSHTPQSKLDKQGKPRFVDMTPTWTALAPALFDVLENPRAPYESKQNVRSEMTRCAQIADRYVRDSNAAREREGFGVTDASGAFSPDRKVPTASLALCEDELHLITGALESVLDTASVEDPEHVNVPRARRLLAALHLKLKNELLP